MKKHKQENLIHFFENHLREMSRQLIQLDTEEEAISYVAHSFREKLYADCVGIFSITDGSIHLHTHSGNLGQLGESFPLPLDQSMQDFLTRNVTSMELRKCTLDQLLIRHEIKTWFTMPLQAHHDHLAFCLVGFYNFTPLLDMDHAFAEFSKDVTAVLQNARQKKKQQRKLQMFEWIRENTSIAAPIEKHIYNLTVRTGQMTNASSAYVYLYNEQSQTLIYHPPAYQTEPDIRHISTVQNDLHLYFPYIGKEGACEISFALHYNAKLLGVLHLTKDESAFTAEDRAQIELLIEQALVLLENAMLYRSEQENNNRMHELLEYQQKLVKETVEVDNFNGITKLVSSMLRRNVILYNRFFQPISHQSPLLAEIDEVGRLAKKEAVTQRKETFAIVYNGYSHLFWAVQGNGDVFGYLALRSLEDELDPFDILTMELARNICSVQFIKHQLVLDANEQVKENFLSLLLSKKKFHKEHLMQYASSLQFDYTIPHEVAVIKLSIDRQQNILIQHRQISHVWDYIRRQLNSYGKSCFLSFYKQRGVLFVPVSLQHEALYGHIEDWAKSVDPTVSVKIGIGRVAEQLEHFAYSYTQAIQTLQLLESGFITQTRAKFQDLGSYMVLHHIEDQELMTMFVDDQIGKLIQYSEKKNRDLYNTLHTFLQFNGHIKHTAEALFIHRSSLLYRIEKVTDMLQVNLDDAETRFNLMMAFKLHAILEKKL